MVGVSSVGRIQILAVPSQDAVTMNWPSGLKAAERTGPCGPSSTRGVPTIRPPHPRGRVPDVVTMNWPSGLNAADWTGPSCPLNTKGSPTHPPATRARSRLAEADDELPRPG